MGIAITLVSPTSQIWQHPRPRACVRMRAMRPGLPFTPPVVSSSTGQDGKISRHSDSIFRVEADCEVGKRSPAGDLEGESPRQTAGLQPHAASLALWAGCGGD